MTMAFLFIRPSEASDSNAPKKLDIPGAVILFAALSTALLAVNRGTSWGWTSPQVLGLLGFSACSLTAFLLIESKVASPVISLALFKVRSYAVGVGSLSLNFLGQSSVTFLMPFYLEQVRDFSTGQTGLVIATVPLMMLILSPISGRISDRYGFVHQTTLGIAIVSVGLLSLATIQAETPIILVKDWPDGGGFINPYTVPGCAFWKLGQSKPGELYRFKVVSVAEAQALARDITALCSEASIEQ